MKKIILGLMAFSSVSVFAQSNDLANNGTTHEKICIVHFSNQANTNDGWDMAEVRYIHRDLAKEFKRRGVQIVGDVHKANIGIYLWSTTMVVNRRIVDNGPYGKRKVADFEHGVHLLAAEDGEVLLDEDYSTLKSKISKSADNILRDLGCKTL